KSCAARDLDAAPLARHSNARPASVDSRRRAVRSSTLTVPREQHPPHGRHGMSISAHADLRRATNPLFNDNKLKLGVVGGNVSSGCAITTAEGRLEITWPNVKTIATLGDQAGFEAMVPVARWKGFGGKTNFNGTCFETYTWAAGLAAC